MTYIEHSPTSKKQFQKKPRKGVGANKPAVSMVADFETTTTAEDCRVWAWGLAYVERPDHVEIDNTLDSFIERVQSHNAIVYFHNLKFDGVFIIWHLMTNGFRHIVGDGNSRIANTFKTLISGMGQYYSITVQWGNGHHTEFRDSLKKLPMPVKRIAKAFKLDEGKGEIDYDAPRPVGHTITPEESDYLRRDVSIVGHAMREIIGNGMTKLTVASDSLAEYKRLTGSKQFALTFPILAGHIDDDIRRAYRGGWTYADPRFKGFVTRSGLVLDVNGLYPSVMRSRILPYGTPIFTPGYVEPTHEYPLIVFTVTFIAKLKRDHLPCIQIKNSAMFAATEYVSEITEPTTLSVTNVDWELYNDQYDIEVIEYGGGWSFHATDGMFDKYIDKWADIKAKEVGGKREIAKLHLTALYGKFASNPNITSKIPTLKDGAVKLVHGEPEVRNPVYTAMGVFITSYARDVTIRAAQENYATFAYSDTDSLHLLRDDVPDGIDVHPTRLGAWKLEYHFEAAFYIRAKGYLEKHAETDCEHDDGPSGHGEWCYYTTHIAGLPEGVASRLTFDELYDGNVLEGKLTAVNVPGGVVLKDIPFELKIT